MLPLLITLGYPLAQFVNLKRLPSAHRQMLSLGLIPPTQTSFPNNEDKNSEVSLLGIDAKFPVLLVLCWHSFFAVAQGFFLLSAK